jgi:hypothetical protein
MIFGPQKLLLDFCMLTQSARSTGPTVQEVLFPLRMATDPLRIPEDDAALAPLVPLPRSPTDIGILKNDGQP